MIGDLICWFNFYIPPEITPEPYIDFYKFNLSLDKDSLKYPVKKINKKDLKLGVRQYYERNKYYHNINYGYK